MARLPAPQTTQKAVPRAAARQRALVVGVSGYPAPITILPAVASDVRAMAKLLASKNGVFLSTGVTVLTEKQATRDSVLKALRAAFTGAKADDTIFVYMAGHGGVEGDGYYFAPYDAVGGHLAESGVSLAEIKRLFDRTASRRVFLWLDFCHSGGILARGGTADDVSVIRRSIGVVSGHGKIIVAACTPTQSAYEDSKLGHGLFTHALLRGLKGEAKSAQGEVTASSLYDFIDHQVKHPKQQPTFFGEMSGRIVLMEYPDRAVATAGSKTKPATTKIPAGVPSAGSVSTSGDLLLLDGRVYQARSVSEQNDGSVVLQVVAKDPEEEAALRGLRSGRSFHSRTVSFAFRNLSFTGQVGEVSSVTAGVKPAWSITLKPSDNHNNYPSDFGYNNLSVEDLVGMRARLLLLGTKPEGSGAWGETMLLHSVQGPLRELGIDEAIFTRLGKQQRTHTADFLRRARLWALYYLKAGKICDDVLELKLGPVRAEKMAVQFRGTRKSRFTGEAPHEVVVKGDCSLK